MIFVRLVLLSLKKYWIDEARNTRKARKAMNENDLLIVVIVICGIFQAVMSLLSYVWFLGDLENNEIKSRVVFWAGWVPGLYIWIVFFRWLGKAKKIIVSKYHEIPRK